MRPIRMHMACGDTIVQSGLIVELHKRYGEIAVPAYAKHEVFVKSLFRSYSGIAVYTVPEAGPWGAPYEYVFDVAMRDARLDIFQEIRLGSYGGADPGTKGTYAKADVPYEKRWDSCPVEDAATYVDQIYFPTDDLVFVHDDPERNFVITKEIDRKKVFRTFHPSWIPNILSYVDILKAAAEIHVIDSAFFCLVTQLEVKAKLFFHRYARIDPTVSPERLDWNIYD